MQTQYFNCPGELLMEKDWDMTILDLLQSLATIFLLLFQTAIKTNVDLDFITKNVSHMHWFLTFVFY